MHRHTGRVRKRREAGGDNETGDLHVEQERYLRTVCACVLTEARQQRNSDKRNRVHVSHVTEKRRDRKKRNNKGLHVREKTGSVRS